jgi:hypothetical protein
MLAVLRREGKNLLKELAKEYDEKLSFLKYKFWHIGRFFFKRQKE